MTIDGTNHFATLESAVSYYWTLENDETKNGHDVAVQVVKEKLAENQIHIGLPPAMSGKKIKLNLNEGRYFYITP